jgi:hypothetical protein
MKNLLLVSMILFMFSVAFAQKPTTPPVVSPRAVPPPSPRSAQPSETKAASSTIDSKYKPDLGYKPKVYPVSMSTVATRQISENNNSGQVNFTRGESRKNDYKVKSSNKNVKPDGDKICTTETITASGGGSEFCLMSPVNTVAPGIIFDSKSIITGNFIEKNLPRGKLEMNSTIISSGVKKSLVTMIGDVSSTKVIDKVREILTNVGNVNLGFNESLKFEQMDSYEQLQIKANASYSGWGQNVKAQLGFANESTKNKLVAYYVSKAFEIIVSGENGGFKDVLAPNTVVPEGAVIVSKVSYGKIISVVAESDLSKEDLEVAVQYAGNFGAGGNATADFDLRKKSMLNSTKINAFVYGATNSITTVVGGYGIDGINKINNYLKGEGSKWDIQNNAAQPISYQLNFLDDGSVASINSTVSYPHTTCIQNVFNFDIRFLGFACSSNNGGSEGGDVNLSGLLTFNAKNIIGECLEIEPKFDALKGGAYFEKKITNNQLCPAIYNKKDANPYTFMKLARCNGNPQGLESQYYSNSGCPDIKSQISNCSNQPSDWISVKTPINTPADQIIFSVSGELTRQMGMGGSGPQKYDSGAFYLKDILAATQKIGQFNPRLVLRGINVNHEVIVYPVFEVLIKN